MASIKREISPKVDKDGKSEIILRFSIKRGYQWRLKSGIYMDASRFKNGSISRPRANPALIKELDDLEKLLGQVETHLIDISKNVDTDKLNKPYLEEAIRMFIKRLNSPEPRKREKKVKGFFDTLTDFIEHRNLSEWRKRRYMVLWRALARFELYRREIRRKTYKLSLDTFNAEDVEDFEKFLRNEVEIHDEYPQIFIKFPSDTRKARKAPKPQAKGDNTIINMFSCLRSFFRDCVEKKLIPQSPFAEYKGTTVEHYGTPYYITLEERNQIADADLSAHPTYAIQRDIFIFQTLIGCRVSDLYRMTQGNVVNGAIEYVASKTKKTRSNTLRVPLNQRGLDLIEKYKGVDPEGRLFPFISQQKYNVAIKKIFELCKITRMVTILNPLTGLEEQKPINELASSHLARRTFVGNLYKKVKDPNLVGALSGHTEGSRAFTRYREIDEEMKKELIGYLD